MTKQQVTFWKWNQQWFDIFAWKITDNQKLPLTSFINKSMYCWCFSLRCLPCSHYICWPQKSLAWCKDFILPTVMTLTAWMQVVYIDNTWMRRNQTLLILLSECKPIEICQGINAESHFEFCLFDGGNILWMCGSQIISTDQNDHCL